MNVEVFVRSDWATETLEFFVTRRVLGGRELLAPAAPADADSFVQQKWIPLMETAVYEPAPPSYRIDRDVFAAMVAKSEGLVEPTAAAERHLADALAHRDRLMAMVEIAWSSQVAS